MVIARRVTRRTLITVCALLATVGIAQRSTAMTITKGVTVDGKICDLVKWKDAAGKDREVALVRANGDVSGYKGGYVQRYTYYIDNTLKTASAWDAAQQFVSGMGCAVNHHSGASSSKANSSNASTSFLFEGTSHCIWRFSSDYSGDNKTIKLVIDWFIRDGSSDILWAVSYDTSAYADGAVQWDARGPYFQFDWDGDGKFYDGAISGIRWGDKYKFRTTNYDGTNSSWDYTQPNIVPYMMLWKDASLGNVECGVVQTQAWTVQDAGGYWWAASHWGQTGTGMMENYNCPFQLNAYEGYAGEKMAWGTNFGYVGSSQYDRLDGVKQSGYPHQGYSVVIVINKYTEGLTDATIASMEACQTAVFTATKGSVVTSGPDHVGLSGNVNYQPAGWDHRYGLWAATCSSNEAIVNLNVPSGTIRRPVFRFDNYAAQTVPTIKLNNSTLSPGVDYYASIDTANHALYITLCKNLSGATNTISVGGSTDAPPAVSVTSPSGGSRISGTVTVTVTATDDKGVSSVEFLVDGASKGFMTNVGGNTWQISWDTTSASEGAHSIAARATDTSSQKTTSQAVSVIVDNYLDPLDDRDSDGMTDMWELAHGLDPQDSSDASEDADGDGYTNLQEFLAGTDPQDPNSVPGASSGGSGISCGAAAGACWLCGFGLFAAMILRRRKAA